MRTRQHVRTPSHICRLPLPHLTQGRSIDVCMRSPISQRAHMVSPASSILVLPFPLPRLTNTRHHTPSPVPRYTHEFPPTRPHHCVAVAWVTRPHVSLLARLPVRRYAPGTIPLMVGCTSELRTQHGQARFRRRSDMAFPGSSLVYNH